MLMSKLRSTATKMLEAFERLSTGLKEVDLRQDGEKLDAEDSQLFAILFEITTKGVD